MLLATVVILTSGHVYAVLANCQPLWCCIFEYLLRRDPRTPFRGYDPKFGWSSHGLAADRPRETAFGNRFGTPGNSGEVDSAAPPFRTSQRFVSDARCVLFRHFMNTLCCISIFHLGLFRRTPATPQPPVVCSRCFESAAADFHRHAVLTARILHYFHR